MVFLSQGLELLVQRTCEAFSSPLSSGEVLRRAFEIVASGIVLPGGPGLVDPCEQDTVNALAHVGIREAEELTHFAQVIHILN